MSINLVRLNMISTATGETKSGLLAPLPPEKLVIIKYYCLEILKNCFFLMRLLLFTNAAGLSARHVVLLARNPGQ